MNSQEIKKRLEVLKYSRKIATSLINVINFDAEIQKLEFKQAEINAKKNKVNTERHLKNLVAKLKNERLNKNNYHFNKAFNILHDCESGKYLQNLLIIFEKEIKSLL